MTKKLLALLMSVLLLAGVLCVPALAEDAAAETETVTAEEAETELVEPAVLDAETAFANLEAYYPGDTTVFTVNGVAATWDIFSYMLQNVMYNAYSMYIYYLGGLPTDLSDGEEELIHAAEEQTEFFLLAHARAAEEGLTLSEEQTATIAENIASLNDRYGEETVNEELFSRLMEYSCDMTNLMAAHVGENGELLTGDEVLSWAEENGYVRTKHILYMFPTAPAAETDEEGNVIESEEYTAALAEYEAGKAAVCAKAEETLAGLNAQKLEGAELEAAFDEVMNAESEDPGVASYPDGYTFTSGTMVPEFEEAAYALEPYGMSGVVESTYGCHIILRLPVTPEDLTMEQNSSTGAYLTVRQAAANELFNAELVEMISSTEPEWELELLSLNEYVAGNGETAPAESEETAPADSTHNKLIALVILAALAVVTVVVALLLRKKPEETAVMPESVPVPEEAPAEAAAAEEKTEK